MSVLQKALIYSLLAGATIPLGGLLGIIEQLLPRWLERELRHTIIAFGGGVLLAAVSLVLVPEGYHALSIPATVFSFLAGGIAFMILDRAIAKHGGSASQLFAMLLDFLPEACAMGASFATGQSTGLVLALLIAFQNLPEGFNAYREIMATGSHPRRTVLGTFFLLPLLGPLASYGGMTVLADYQNILGAIMLFSSGGILYLTFQDIAPQAKLKRHWGPPLGAVLGFLLGLTGHMLII